MVLPEKATLHLWDGDIGLVPYPILSEFVSHNPLPPFYAPKIVHEFLKREGADCVRVDQTSLPQKLNSVDDCHTETRGAVPSAATSFLIYLSLRRFSENILSSWRKNTGGKVSRQMFRNYSNVRSIQNHLD